MKKRKAAQNQSFEAESVEQWLKNYFLDPQTSHCDFTQFKIDLYETNKDWIVEAVLNEYVSSDITVKIEYYQLIITAQEHSYTHPCPFKKRVRTIEFPFLIIDHEVNATFQNGVLEIFISKRDKIYGKNRFITLP